MKLFFALEFSSLADHIALLEAGIDVELVEVDLDSKRLADGGDYRAVNARGQVPALQFDDGTVLTENVAILAWIADRAPQLAPGDAFGRYRLLEQLALIASEIHTRFPILLALPDDARAPVAAEILRWFAYCSERLGDGFLLGERFGVADAYLFVMARGALEMDMPLDARLRDYVARVDARPAVQRALQRERALHARNGGGDDVPAR